MALVCPRCEGPVMGEPHGYTMSYDPNEGPPERWTLLKCPRDHALLVLQNEFSGLTFDDDDPFRVYPPQDRHLSTEIPQPLRSAHEEARKCLRAKAYTAAVAMSGRTLEGACELQGVKENTLQRSLGKMKEGGLIDGRLWDWAETLRGVRNAASHFNNEELTRQDAEDALAFSEALLDYLYVLTARFNALKERRTTEKGVSDANGSA
jgi:hypothetical protein